MKTFGFKDHEKEDEENVTEHKNMDEKNQPKINNNHSLPFENNHHFYEKLIFHKSFINYPNCMKSKYD